MGWVLWELECCPWNFGTGLNSFLSLRFSYLVVSFCCFCWKHHMLSELHQDKKRLMFGFQSFHELFGLFGAVRETVLIKQTCLACQIIPWSRNDFCIFWSYTLLEIMLSWSLQCPVLVTYSACVLFYMVKRWHHADEVWQLNNKHENEKS